MEFITTGAPRERACLVAVESGRQEAGTTQELLRELADLTKTYGAEIVSRRILNLDEPRPRYHIGSGQAEELAKTVAEEQVNLVIFDEDLSPTQQRNLEKLLKVTVIDRHELILKIFGNRACTREAELQIELATAEYSLPRLKRAWTHLNRQRGGVGLRGGEGEQQIEVDQRLVRRRIGRLKTELALVRRRRAEQRKKRREIPVPTAAIVGYTNAGKSSLLNSLTRSDVLVEDKLFATLDPTTKRLRLPNNQVMLLTDTVGFVRKLPHALVEAFKATLEEAVLADFLIHVADIGSNRLEDHMATTREVLTEIGAGDKPSLLVFNKIDIEVPPYTLARLRRHYPEALFISIKTGEGLPELLDRLAQIDNDRLVDLNLRIPQDQYHLVAFLHRSGHVLSQTYEEDAIYIRAAVPRNRRAEVAPYLVTA